MRRRTGDRPRPKRYPPPKPISQPPLTTYQMLVSLSKNSPATNSHRPVATIATTITNRRALRIDSPTVCTGVLEIDVGQRLPVGVADDEAGVGFIDGPRRWEAAGTNRARTSSKSVDEGLAALTKQWPSPTQRPSLPSSQTFPSTARASSF